MERYERTPPAVSAALVVAGLWMRVGAGAAFAALSAPLLFLHDGLRPGDAFALLVIAAGVAWLAWRRTRALLGDEPRATAPAEASAPRRPATA